MTNSNQLENKTEQFRKQSDYITTINIEYLTFHMMSYHVSTAAIPTVGIDEGADGTAK